MTSKTLIALVDGSAYSESVCHHAAWIAGRNGWGVKLYHVLDQPTETDTADRSGTIRLGARSRILNRLAELDAARAKVAHEHGRAILDDARAIVEAHAGSEGGIAVETRLRQGDPIETFAAKESAGEMVVIGKRGEAASPAMVQLGANVESIVRACHRPLFLANRAFRPIERALIAFDGGTSSLKAVDYIARSPLFAGLAVSLVFAGRETPRMRQSLDAAAATLRAGGLEAKTILRDGEPEKVLAEMTGTDSHDLLVMGAYGHSRVRALIIGSTTTAMLRSCHVPVLILR